jgi:hypothetical protein
MKTEVVWFNSNGHIYIDSRGYASLHIYVNDYGTASILGSALKCRTRPHKNIYDVYITKRVDLLRVISLKSHNRLLLLQEYLNASNVEDKVRLASTLRTLPGRPSPL